MDPTTLRARLVEHIENDQADHEAVTAAMEEYLESADTEDAPTLRAMLQGHISATDASHARLMQAVDAHIERIGES